mmetsp:Transcript_11162/g.26821  ORF Transcript_11162/g.26821 Transcript_11162/m.26821 type:complete len:225 (-) Transcript_11162:1272-1946(-)
MGAWAYLNDEVLIMAVGDLGDGMEDEAADCYHKVNRDHPVHHNEEVGEHMDSLVEALVAEAAHIKILSAPGEDRTDSMHHLPDSDAYRVVNMVAALNPSMALHYLNNYHYNQVVVVGRHKSMLLRAMRLVLMADKEELPRGKMNHLRDYQNYLFLLKLVSRLEKEVQSHLHSRSENQTYFDATDYCKDHHSVVKYYCIQTEECKIRYHCHCFPPEAKMVVPSWV